jgi:hypothetical protein
MGRINVHRQFAQPIYRAQRSLFGCFRRAWDYRFNESAIAASNHSADTPGKREEKCRECFVIFCRCTIASPTFLPMDPDYFLSGYIHYSTLTTLHLVSIDREQGFGQMTSLMRFTPLPNRHAGGKIISAT